MCGGGGIGGILGGLAGGAADFLFPEVGIPLSLAVGLGSGLGSTAGGLASGEKFGTAALGGLESGGIAGALSGLGSLVGGGDFFATPGALTGGGAGGASNLAGGLSAETSAAAPGTAGIAGTPAGGIGVGTSFGLPSSLGSGPADVSGALPTLTQGVGAAGPLGDTGIAGAAGPVTGTSLTGDQILSNAGITQTPAQEVAADVAADPTGTATGTNSFLSGLGDKALGFAEKNPGALIGAGGILYSALANNSIPGLSNLQNQAKLLSTTGAPESQALQTGQLPAGAQAALDQANQAAEAETRSRYANLGLGGSTMEAQGLASVDQAGAAAKFGMLNQTAQTGLQQIGAANQLYTQIMQTELAQDQQTQNSIARFAAALAGLKTAA